METIYNKYSLSPSVMRKVGEPINPTAICGLVASFMRVIYISRSRDVGCHDTSACSPTLRTNHVIRDFD